MAIQIPNPGTGNGATGDNEFVLWSKVKDNFTDQTNAASRLVGTGAEQVPLTKQTFKASQQVSNSSLPNAETPVDMSAVPLGSIHFLRGVEGQTGYPDGWGGLFQTIYTTLGIGNGTKSVQTAYSFSGTSARLAFRGNSADQAWAEVYTNKNTTIVNGSLKPSSPVVKIHTDSLELNDDAERMGVTLNKRGVGDYLLQNTTGLRNDGGWRIELPQDVNGNPYFAVDYNELENNDIEVKTYKRIFDMNTFMFGPDLDSPVDIKEGSSIAIRFNDLPQDDVQTEV